MENSNKRRNSGILAILFDLDNTLIATRKADSKACTKLSEIISEKYEIQREKSFTICCNFLKNFRKCPDNPSMNLDAWRNLLWSGSLGEEYNHLAESIYKEWLSLRCKYLMLTPEVKSLLQHLRQNYLVGLITNGPSSAQWEKVERLNLKAYFDIILVSGDLPWEKPHEKIFHEACDYLGIEPHQCIMVGDKLETDVLGGIAANLGGTVWIPLSSKKLDANDPIPDYILDNVTDLISLLPQLKKPCDFRTGISKTFNKLCLSDVDDCNSNSSDGS